MNWIIKNSTYITQCKEMDSRERNVTHEHEARQNLGKKFSYPILKFLALALIC